MHKTRVRIVFCTLIVCLFCNSVFSQKSEGFIKGKLVDSLTRGSLKFGTIAVYVSEDSSLITFRLSDADGYFRVPGLPVARTLKVIISYAGYWTLKKEIYIPRDSLGLNGIVFSLSRKDDTLEEILVTAERPPIIVKNDTIEFNASSFKVLPNAIVEDLFRKLPGVDVDLQGNIRVNGRLVTRLMVDSKEFFGSDPRIATKNLPANIIEKIQASTDLEQQAQNPTMPLDQLGVVINLTLKRQAKKGAFGKVYLGAGTKNRYENGGLLNIFRDTLQVSLLGYGNNTNTPAFGSNDLLSLGGFRRSFFRNMNLNADGTLVNIDGLSFGGNTIGKPTNRGGGINLNHVLNKAVTLNFQYFHSYGRNELRQTNVTEQLIKDTNFVISENRNEQQRITTDLISGSIRYKPNKMVNILYRPTLTISRNRSSGRRDFISENNFYSPLNNSINNESGNTSQSAYSHEMNFTSTKGKKPGTSIFLVNTVSVGNNTIDVYNDATSYYFRDNTSINIDQFRPSSFRKVYTNTTINYSLPKTAKLMLRISEAISTFYERDNLLVLESINGNGIYNLVIDSLSYMLIRNGFRNTLNPYLSWNISKKIGVSAGINAHNILVNNKVDKEKRIRQNYLRIYPFLQIQFIPFSFTYTNQINEPNILDLFPVVNNSNPLLKLKGNPELLPTTTHTLALSTSKYYQKSLTQIFMVVRTNVIENAVIRARNVFKDGVQEIQPFNRQGVWNSYLTSGLTKTFTFRNKNKLILRPSTNISYNRNKVILNSIEASQNQLNVTTTIEYNLSFHELVELSQNYKFTQSSSSYPLNEFENYKITLHRLESNIMYRASKKLIFENSLTYQYFPEAPTAQKASNLLWNSSVKVTFLRNDNAMIKITGFDIMNRNVGLLRVINENYTQSGQTDILNRYFMLSIIYNIKSFYSEKRDKQGLF